MSKFNKKKTGFSEGIIAGKETTTAGKYTDEHLLRRVTMCNLLWESTYYQTADEIMNQMNMLIPKVSPEYLAELAVETRFEQKLRHTPIYLALCLYKYHKATKLCEETLAKICTRPDMTMDALAMLPHVMGRKSMKPIPNCVKRGLARAFDNYDYYQIAKYRRVNSDISLIDVVNLVHPSPNENNERALQDLVNGELRESDTWETKLSKGDDKKATFTDMIERGKLGALATLRNLRNMITAGVSRSVIKKGLGNVRSSMLTPLNFLAASRNAPEYTKFINQAMERSFVGAKIQGTTIIALDVSGSMGGTTSSNSNFSRLDIGFALMAVACYMFEDPILVYTAGSDGRLKGAHMLAPTTSGLGVFNDHAEIIREIGGGGIFTAQLCKWLKDKGLAKDADRLVVISDSQDIDVSRGSKVKPDTSPYKTSYIIDISHHTHGIKTGNWTAEINGSSDKLFRYIYELEKSSLQVNSNQQ